jgi:hypothetical protein
MGVQQCSMLSPCALQWQTVGQLPRGLAERGLAERHLFSDIVARKKCEAKLRVLLPVPVTGHLGQTAKARLALAQGGFIDLGQFAAGHVGQLNQHERLVAFAQCNDGHARPAPAAGKCGVVVFKLVAVDALAAVQHAAHAGQQQVNLLGWCFTKS